jgi:hypothetical protein
MQPEAAQHGVIGRGNPAQIAARFLKQSSRGLDVAPVGEVFCTRHELQGPLALNAVLLGHEKCSRLSATCIELA